MSCGAEITMTAYKEPEHLPGVALKVRHAHEVLGLSYREMTEQSGISPATLCRIEKGGNPDFHTLRSLEKWKPKAEATE